MEELRKKVKMHSIKLMIFWFVLAILAIVLLFIFVKPKSLVSYCQIKTVGDIDRCYKENPYVEIHTTKVYDTDYDYTYNNKVVARFVDIDINGHSMIALMTPSLAQKHFDDETGNIVIKGRLEKFDSKAKLKGYKAIQEIYIKRFAEEETREEVLSFFTPVQLNQYQSTKMGIYFGTLVGIAASILFLILGIKQIKWITHPEKYRLTKNISLEDESEVEKILKELESGNYEYEKNKTYLTKNYFIIKNGFMQVAERKNVAWIYEKIIKQNGITTGKSWIIFSLDQKAPFTLAGFGKKHDELGQLLRKAFPNATFGYSNQLCKQWNQNPASFIKKDEE